MNTKGKENFIQLTQNESAGRLDALSSIQSVIKLWQKGSVGQLAASMGKKNEGMSGTLEIVADKPLAFDPSLPLYFSFSLSKIKYFAQIKLLPLQSSGILGHYQIQLCSDLFRTEKREHERVMVYPMYRAYAYFALPVQVTSNITSLHRIDPAQNDQFTRYLKQRMLKDNQWGEMTGLQIIDLSASGLSCIANGNEAELLIARKDNPLIVDFKGEQYRINSSRVVHDVDYIDPRFQKVRMRKLGIEFLAPSSELSSLLDHFQDFSTGINSTESSFEDILT